ncbi:hypothetical protein BDN70DRAFT_939514 [Pholiota conissans]|uniref:Uncharacterized protein n=1 Tax=Pholiota conissans TaxID=109636 RepID=A0A9P6CL34_9AGAR|nr:hypothetical protein BDN70DRAFT_939514 [Pholiota conissans]
MVIGLRDVDLHRRQSKLDASDTGYRQMPRERGGALQALFNIRGPAAALASLYISLPRPPPLTPFPSPPPTAMDAIPPPPPASSVVPLSSSSSKETVVVQASIFLIVPVFALVLAARVFLRRYHSRRALIAVHRDGSGGQIYTACAMLVLLISLGTLAGALPLSQALGGTLDEGETTKGAEVVQALMGFLVGAVVLHLTSTTADSDALFHRKWHRIISAIQKMHRISLVIILCSGTYLAFHLDR